MAEFDYLSGLGNHHQSEAIAGALPVGRNSPQRPPLGLYAEKFSGTAFTVPRSQNLRSWFYRIRPSVTSIREVRRMESTLLKTAPHDAGELTPEPLRWDPFVVSDTPIDFVDGLATLATAGAAKLHTGVGIHIYRANRSMDDRFFINVDGELLLVPQRGALLLLTECGAMELLPGEVGVVPRGMKFQVNLASDAAMGYVCENYGQPFALPERGVIGSDGLANERDFYVPTARFEDRPGHFELITKLGGELFSSALDHWPLDVVAWHGNLAPYRYEVSRFNALGSISFDHPDPSIFTVLSSPSEWVGTANADFVIFPERWLVMEDTFRPPWFHRNVMSEFMGLIEGSYDAKPGAGFSPGGASLHNAMTPHGPDADAHRRASTQALEPERLSDTLAFMFESRFVLEPTEFAIACPERQQDYAACWRGLENHFSEK